MSVVQGETARRWSVVAGVVALLVAVPVVGPAVRARVAGAGVVAPAPADVVRRALAADTDLAWSGLAESRGGTSLPDLPSLSDVTAILGGTTRARVWWAGPDRWRVDTLALTGEHGVYGTPAGVVTWDYEANTLTDVVGAPRVRFPRADDLLPPQAAHRLLGGLARTDRVTALPGTRLVAGRAATGVRVVPGDRRATVTSADVWADAASGLPLAVTVRGPGGEVALETTFLDVRLGAPPAAVVDPPAAPGADRDVVTEPDLVAQIDRFARRRLPDRLGGLDRTDALTGRVATYGAGLARFTALPLPRRLGGQVVRAAVSKGAQELAVRGGRAYLLRSGVLTVVVAQDGDGDRVFLLSGLVDEETLRLAAQDALALTVRTG